MYNSYFGFSLSPFSVTPDPNFFYTNPVYQEAYANLRYGIESKKGFIVLTSAVRTTRTPLLRKLMHNVEGTIHTVFVFNTYLDFTELLQVILYDLGLAPKEPSRVTMLQELNDYLLTQLKQAHIVTVLVDEAQNLSDDALQRLRLLSNLATDQEKLIQIVLMGQPELQTRLDRPGLRQLKQRVALQCRLVPLKDEEVGPYIDFRLRVAGYKGKDLFHPDALRQIAFYSNGIPRLVNIICDNALLCTYARSQTTLSTAIIRALARDLSLKSEAQITQTEAAAPVPVSEARAESETVDVPPQHKVMRTVRVGVETCLTLLAFFILASVIDPKNLLTVAGRSFEVAKHNLNQWALLITHQEAVPEKVTPEVKSDRKEQRIIIPHGSSIYRIAADTYGANTALGMDLIKEFNPEIKNLNRISGGKNLLLPSLTPETLLRQRPDGLYRLIVASFRSQTQANEYAGRLNNKGYQVTITPRRVTDSLVFYGVEIDGLKIIEEANVTWLAGLRNEWLVFAGNPDATSK